MRFPQGRAAPSLPLHLPIRLHHLRESVLDVDVVGSNIEVLLVEAEVAVGLYNLSDGDRLVVHVLTHQIGYLYNPCGKI